MFCNSCKLARPANETPCPNCGAPSSLQAQFEAAAGSRAPHIVALDPTHMSMQLVPVSQQQLAIPDVQQETVYIPPMYTKPRPILARPRIISGILSILIVSLLLCAGSIYYANVTGKVTAIQRLLGIIPPANVQTAKTAQIADPPDKVDWGPARNIIPAAATTLHVDPKSLAPRERDTIIPIGVPFYVTLSVVPPKAGSVVLLWNMNGHLYHRSQITPVLQPSGSDDLPCCG